MSEHGSLARREKNRLIADKHLARHGIKSDVAERQRNTEKISRPPQQCLQAGNELLERKGLDEIIVSTALQPDDAVFEAAARGQDQDRCRILPPAHLAETVKAVGVGQPEIQYDDFKSALAQRRSSVFCRWQHVDYETRPGEAPLE